MIATKNSNTEKPIKKFEHIQIEDAREDTLLKKYEGRLLFMSEEDRFRVFVGAERITTEDGKTRHTRTITDYKKTDWNAKNRKGKFAKMSPESYSNSPPFLAGGHIQRDIT